MAVPIFFPPYLLISLIWQVFLAGGEQTRMSSPGFTGDNIFAPPRKKSKYQEQVLQEVSRRVKIHAGGSHTPMGDCTHATSCGVG